MAARFGRSKWVFLAGVVALTAATLPLGAGAQAPDLYGTIEYTNTQLTFSAFDESFPQFSPDGTQIVYMADSEPGTSWDSCDFCPALHIRDVDDTTTATGPATRLETGSATGIDIMYDVNQLYQGRNHAVVTLGSSYSFGGQTGIDPATVVVTNQDVATPYSIAGNDYTLTEGGGSDGNLATKHDNTLTLADDGGDGDITGSTPLFVSWWRPFMSSTETLTGTTPQVIDFGVDLSSIVVSDGSGNLYTATTDYVITSTAGTDVDDVWDDTISIARVGGGGITDGATVTVSFTRWVGGFVEHVFPQWSPDGQWIVFKQNIRRTTRDGGASYDYAYTGRAIDEIWAIRPDGTGLRQLWGEDDGGYRYDDAQWPFFGPDGRVAFALLGNEDQSNTSPFSEDNINYAGLAIVDPDTPGGIVIHQRVGGKGGPLSGLEWSPDGTHIKFARSDDQGSTQFPNRIYVVNATTGVETLVSDGTKDSPHWSAWTPDSQWLVYAQADDNNDSNKDTSLYIVRRDGNDRTLLKAWVDNPGGGLPNGRYYPGKPAVSPVTGPGGAFQIAYQWSNYSRDEQASIWEVTFTPTGLVVGTPRRLSQPERVTSPLAGVVSWSATEGGPCLTAGSVLGTVGGVTLYTDRHVCGLDFLVDNGATVTVGQDLWTRYEFSGWPSYTSGGEYLVWRGYRVEDGAYGTSYPSHPERYLNYALWWAATPGGTDATPLLGFHGAAGPFTEHSPYIAGQPPAIVSAGGGMNWWDLSNAGDTLLSPVAGVVEQFLFSEFGVYPSWQGVANGRGFLVINSGGTRTTVNFDRDAGWGEALVGIGDTVTVGQPIFRYASGSDMIYYLQLGVAPVTSWAEFHTRLRRGVEGTSGKVFVTNLPEGTVRLGIINLGVSDRERSCRVRDALGSRGCSFTRQILRSAGGTPAGFTSVQVIAYDRGGNVISTTVAVVVLV